MIKINIKPLSVNGAFKGRRFRTDEYRAFQKLLTLSLPNRLDVPDGKLRIILEFGLSSKNADWDNPIKQAQDIISKKYGFNDRMIYQGIVTKVDVAKGQEYLAFKIEKFEI